MTIKKQKDIDNNTKNAIEKIKNTIQSIENSMNLQKMIRLLFSLDDIIVPYSDISYNINKVNKNKILYYFEKLGYEIHEHNSNLGFFVVISW